MKIATITFHWGTNYGAVLQAYALQKFLERQGFRTEVIDYIPISRMKRMIGDVIQFHFSNVRKEMKLEMFRRKNLALSPEKYRKKTELVKTNDEYQVFITGSDQVWNESFIKYGEGRFCDRPILVYYLQFVQKPNKRVSYAASFGTDHLSQYTIENVLPELQKFKAISVRENTGKHILEQLGLNAKVVADPTILLDRQDYEILCETVGVKENKVFKYILHEERKLSSQICNYLERFFGESIVEKKDYGLEEWLYSINHSELVVTNSYHGLILSIIFHTNFIIIPVVNSKMNDRLYTILDRLGMNEHILTEFHSSKIKRIIDHTIDWDRLDRKIAQYREESAQYLLNAIRR